MRRTKLALSTSMLCAASMLCACASVSAPEPTPSIPARPAPAVDVCGPSLAEVARLQHNGELDAALKEAKNGSAACPEHGALRSLVASITIELGDDGPAGSLADARALWTEAAGHAAQGRTADANQANDRALHITEMLTGEKAELVRLKDPQLVNWRDGQAWFSVGAIGAVVRVDVIDQELQPLFIYDLSALLPRVDLPTKHRDWVILSGGDKVSLYKSPMARPLTVDGSSAELTPNEDRLVVTREQAVSLIDTATGDELGQVQTITSPRYGRVLRDGEYFAAFGSEGSFHSESPALLVDLGTMKAQIDDGIVRAGAISKSGKYAAAVVVDSNDQPVDKLLIWKIGAATEPLSIPLGSSHLYEIPGLVFDAAENNVQLGYAEPSGMGMRPSAKVHASFSLLTGKNASSSIVFPPIDYHAAEARQTSNAKKLSGRGYEPLSERYSIISNNFSPNSQSQDGSTSVFVEAIRSGEDEWSDPRAVFVDQRTKKVKSRLALRAGRVGAVDLQLSPDGRWLLACLDQDISNQLVDRDNGTIESLPDVSCSELAFTPDSRFAIAGDHLVELATKQELRLPPELCRIGPVLAPRAVCRE